MANEPNPIQQPTAEILITQFIMTSVVRTIRISATPAHVQSFYLKLLQH